MKKILLIFSVVAIIYIVTQTALANECPGNCRIKDNPSPGLERYFSDADTILSNISSQGRSHTQTQADTNIFSSLRQERQRVIGSLNRTLNF